LLELRVAPAQPAGSRQDKLKNQPPAHPYGNPCRDFRGVGVFCPYCVRYYPRAGVVGTRLKKPKVELRRRTISGARRVVLRPLAHLHQLLDGRPEQGQPGTPLTIGGQGFSEWW
jgi:hypothetical protein